MRHQKNASDQLPTCERCGQRWPCDAAQLRAALRDVLTHVGELRLVGNRRVSRFRDSPAVSRARAVLAYFDADEVAS